MPPESPGPRLDRAQAEEACRLRTRVSDIATYMSMAPRAAMAPSVRSCVVTALTTISPASVVEGARADALRGDDRALRNVVPRMMSATTIGNSAP